MLFQNVLFTVSILGVGQGLLLALLVFINPKVRPILRSLLTLQFAVWSVAMLLITLVNSGSVQENLAIEALEYCLGFIVGPLLWAYLYIRQKPESWLTWRILLHFLPAAIFLLYVAYSFTFELHCFFPILLVMLHLQFYLVWCSWLYFQQKKRYAFVLKNDIAPLMLLLLGIVGFAQWLRFAFCQMAVFDLIVPAVVSFSFYGITLFGFQRSFHFEKSIAKKAYFSMPLQKIESLNELMRAQALYQKPDLTLNQVAIHLGVHPNQLSAFFNQHFRQNFRDYINAFRIEKAKELLVAEDTTRWTIEAIAQEAGFQSRSAFYKAFKTIERSTPHQFRKEKCSK